MARSRLGPGNGHSRGKKRGGKEGEGGGEAEGRMWKGGEGIASEVDRKMNTACQRRCRKGCTEEKDARKEKDARYKKDGKKRR